MKSLSDNKEESKESVEPGELIVKKVVEQPKNPQEVIPKKPSIKLDELDDWDKEE